MRGIGQFEASLRTVRGGGAAALIRHGRNGSTGQSSVGLTKLPLALRTWTALSPIALFSFVQLLKELL